MSGAVCVVAEDTREAMAYVRGGELPGLYGLLRRDHGRITPVARLAYAGGSANAVTG
jgi:hypothetical protein